MGCADAVATEAMRQNDRTALAILTRLGHPGALESLNLAERLQGKAQTPAPAQAFEGWREAEAEFEKLASRHFVGDAFGQTGGEQRGCAPLAHSDRV